MSKKSKFDNNYSSLESSEDTKKYIKEMHEMADKNARTSNIVFTAVGIPILVIILVTIIQMFSFTINLAKGNGRIKAPEVVSDTNKPSQGNSDKSGTDQSGQDNKNTSVQDNTGKLNDKIYTYLNDKANRTSSLNKAIKLNNGSDKGLSTIFVAQILRDNGYNIPNTVINTDSLVKQLEKDGWEKITDYNKLEKGDVCFTTKSKSGSPSQTYIFMGWITEGKTDYGNIVDNQVSEYKDTLHKRNISVSTPKKDKFEFLMRKKQ